MTVVITTRHARRSAWLLLLLAICTPSQAAHPADSPAERAAKKLAWDVESRKSVEIRARTDIESHVAANGRKPTFNAYDDHYIETATGRRFNEHRNLLDERLVGRTEDYGDGARYAHVDFSKEDLQAQNTVAINRQYHREDLSDSKNLPVPLRFEFVGREPLHKALAKAESLGEAKVLDRPCDVFLFRGVRLPVTQDQVFSLDRETAIPLKVAAYRDDAARGRDEPLWVWTAETVGEMAGHTLVTHSSQVTFSSKDVPKGKWKHRIESVAFDKPYPDPMFWPTIQPGATVYDSFTKKIQEPTAVVAPEPQAPPQAVVSSSPATPPSSWTGYVPSVILIGGVAILLVAAVFWRRSRA